MLRALALCVALLLAQAAMAQAPANKRTHVQSWTLGEIGDPPKNAPVCGPLSKALLAQHAVNNTVLITVVDRLSMKKFGRSWIKNVEAANITYAFVAALDPWTSRTLGHWGIKRCFNAPSDRLPYKGTDKSFSWGSDHWAQTTWNKVHVVHAVYELGFHVIHSDVDVSWFRDPMPFFSRCIKGPAHAFFSSDLLETRNNAIDPGLEIMTSPNLNINTGVYFIRQYPNGTLFFQEWLKLKHLGHDQEGLNTLARGDYHRGEEKYGQPEIRWGERMYESALVKGSLVSLLSVSMFGNAYTFVNGQVHKQLGHPLYEIHWVWSGRSMESKQQTMREAMKFWDPPEYYTTPNLVTMDVWVPEPYPGFNDTPFNHTERMIQFHIHAANAQLRQAYYGFLAAMALDRVLVMPRFQCFCAKNWYMTHSCRINEEFHTVFPFNCSLSNLMRVRKLLHGAMKIKEGGRTKVASIREYTFLENPNVPDGIKKSRLILMPANQPRAASDVSTPSTPLTEEKLPNGTVLVRVPWPLDDRDLRALLAPLEKRFRVIHFANATKILGRGFHDPAVWTQFDEAIAKMTTYWCCRSPRDMERFNATDLANLRIVPAERDPTANNFRAVFGIERHMGGYNASYFKA